MRRLRDALGKGDWFSELFALSGLAWAVAEIIVVKINLSPFSSQTNATKVHADSPSGTCGCTISLALDAVGGRSPFHCPTS